MRPSNRPCRFTCREIQVILRISEIIHFRFFINNGDSNCEDISSGNTEQKISLRQKVSYNVLGDMLIFMPGQEDIEVTCDSITG